MVFLRNTPMGVHKVKLYPNYWDLAALLFVLTLFTLFAWDARQMTVPYELGQVIPITLDPHALPIYALRTTVRMLIALFVSLLFTFIFGTWAAKSRRAGRIIIPIIDVLQSVPILGFLSLTVVFFIGLFPGSILGPECAAIFVIFTSQAWNMALGFYQTVRTVPFELREAAAMFHLSAWQRFWRIDVPFSLPGLLWNMMMSMSAGWFFVVASEAISVANQQILLPGIGSYIALAIHSSNMHAIVYAILTMFLVILIYDQILFRPLVAWAEKFKSEQMATEEEAQSWVVNLFHRTRLLRLLGTKVAQLANGIINVQVLRSKPHMPIPVSTPQRAQRKWLAPLRILLWTICILGAFLFVTGFILEEISLSAILHVLMLGFITATRVFVMIILCSLIWVPIGIWIGLRPNVASIAQPVAQFLAAFPANCLYPLVVMFIVTYHANPNIWLTPLMILGAQWYILFNVVAGASMMPKDLLQAADNFGVHYWLRWRRVYLPGIFPYYITGALTAAGGAWNASIVAEVVYWGNERVSATGLGAYISEFTTAGNFTNVVLGISMMCILVLLFNRFIWHPLYLYAETHFQME